MLQHFAAPRLSAVQNFFRTNSDADLLGAYSWNQAVASALLPILGDFEVALRNALHSALSQYYGGVDSFNWMMPRPNPANPGGQPVQAHHKMKPTTKIDIQNTIGKVKAKKPASYIVTPDDVVASVTFGFWEQLINSLAHPSHPAGLQGSILSRVFPYAPDLAVVPHSAPAFKNRTVKLLTRIRDIRNRIGHHDSIWASPEFDLHGAVGFSPRRPRHTIISLSLAASRICWFASWLSPNISRHIQASDHWHSLHLLLDRHALAAYRSTGGAIGTYEKVLSSRPIRPVLRKSARRINQRPAYKQRLEMAQFHF